MNIGSALGSLIAAIITAHALTNVGPAVQPNAMASIGISPMSPPPVLDATTTTHAALAITSRTPAVSLKRYGRAPTRQ